MPRKAELLRIAIVTTSYPREAGDPAGHFVETEARALARAGHDVHVIAPGPRGSAARPRPADSSGLTVWSAGGGPLFGTPGALVRAKQNPLRLLWLAEFVPQVMTRLRALGPIDRTVAHFVIPSGYPCCLGPNVGKLELVLHGSDARLMGALPRAVRRHMVRRLLGRGAHFRFVSEELATTFCATLDEREQTQVRAASRVELPAISVARVDGAAASRCRASRGAAPMPLWVACGRLIDVKRVDRAIREAARHGARLAVVGDGPLRAELEALADLFEPRALFIGAVTRPQALAWIAGADKLVHLSEAEGAPTVIREARALGVPVLATPVGDVPLWAASDAGIELFSP